jgi:two-component system phosphate regulon response regulator PhoB
VSYILVAEDDPHIQLLVRRKLENAGYQVRTVPNGTDALRLALESEIIPRVMLIDVLLPDKNGLDICREVKARLGDAAPPVIIMSALGREADVLAGEAAGADDYLIKPFAPKQLLEHVHTYARRAVAGY